MYLIDRTTLAYPGEICALGYWVRFWSLTCPHLLNMSISGFDPMRANEIDTLLCPHRGGQNQRKRPAADIRRILEGARFWGMSRRSCPVPAHHSKRSFYRPTSNFLIGYLGPVPDSALARDRSAQKPVRIARRRLRYRALDLPRRTSVTSSNKCLERWLTTSQCDSTKV